MTDYSFHTLNPTDLERLACDLLNAQEKGSSKKYRTFKAGKDKGIDWNQVSLENKLKLEEPDWDEIADNQ